VTRAQRHAFLIAGAVVGGLALSGAIAFRRRPSSSSSGPREQVGEGYAPFPFMPSPAPTMPAPPRGAALDAQYLVNGKKVSLVMAKKPASGTGADGVANRTRGAGTGTGLGLDG
jgi:hypothetical protein